MPLVLTNPNQGSNQNQPSQPSIQIVQGQGIDTNVVIWRLLPILVSHCCGEMVINVTKGDLRMSNSVKLFDRLYKEQPICMMTTMIKQMQQRWRELLDQFPKERREQNSTSWKTAKDKRKDMTFKVTKAKMRKQR